MAICRIWRGTTTAANADAYEHLLRREIFVGIAERGIAGFQGIELLRRDQGEAGEAHPSDEVEFITLMWFDSLEAVREFAGTDYQAAVVPQAARLLLKRFDQRSAHYLVRERVAARGVTPQR